MEDELLIDGQEQVDALCLGETTMVTPTLGKLAAALAKSQLELSQPKKSKVVDMTLKSGRRVTYKYAELVDSLESIKVLNRNGIAVSQPVFIKDQTLTINTILMHESGEYIFCPCSWPITDTDPKSAGSLITYLRRYALAMAGIAAEEDNDSQTHSPSDDEGNKKRETVKPPVDVYVGTKEQKIILAKIFLESGVDGPKDQNEISKKAIEQAVPMSELKDWVSSL